MPNKKNKTQIKCEFLSYIYDAAIDGTEDVTLILDLIEKIQKPLREHHSIDLFLETEDRINFSFNGPEILLLLQALMTQDQKVTAKYYIDNYQDQKSNQELWATVSEILNLKTVGKISMYDVGALYEYKARVESGLTPNKAAEEVNNHFNFPSQEACNKWIHEEINRQQNRGLSLFNHITKPQKSPT